MGLRKNAGLPIYFVKTEFSGERIGMKYERGTGTEYGTDGAGAGTE